MQATRRAVLRAAAATPLAIAFGTFAGPAWAAVDRSFVRGTWSPFIGRTFTLAADGRTAKATLSSLSDLHGARPGARQRFSLVFSADRELPEGTVTVRRRGFPAVSLFMTAVDRGVDAQHRQAVINRI
jgi:hypothetical protein